MSTVAATSNAGMTELIQFLSSSGSPLASSGLSSSQIQSVLQNASPDDIVQLSSQALRSQEIDGLFGSSDTSAAAGLYSASSASSSSGTLASVLASLSGTTDTTTSNTTDASGAAAASSSTSSVASQFANYQSTLQAEEMQALLGTGATNGVTGTSLNVLA